MNHANRNNLQRSNALLFSWDVFKVVSLLVESCPLLVLQGVTLQPHKLLFFFFNTTFTFIFFDFSGCVLNLFVSYKVLYIKMYLYRCPVRSPAPSPNQPLIL